MIVLTIREKKKAAQMMRTRHPQLVARYERAIRRGDAEDARKAALTARSYEIIVAKVKEGQDLNVAEMAKAARILGYEVPKRRLPQVLPAVEEPEPATL